MSKAYILNETLPGEDQATITSILEDQGFKPIFEISADIAAVAAPDDIAVVCLPSAPGDEDILATRAQVCAAAGLRVIGIWLREEQAELPAGLGDFGTATVAATSDALGDVLRGEDEAVWEVADGSPRPDQPTPRNKC